MGPSLGAAKVDKILTQASLAYRPEGLISDILLPSIKVKEKTGLFAKYGKENLRTYEGSLFRAPGTRAMTMDYTVSQGNYVCREKSIEKLVPDEHMNNTDEPYNAKRDALWVAQDNIALNKEAALANALSDTSVMVNNTTLTGADQWTDPTSTPIQDIEAGLSVITAGTGKVPNVIAMGFDVYKALKSHPQIQNLTAGVNTGGVISESRFETIIKEHFGVEEVLIGKAVINTGKPGEPDSMGYAWGGNFWAFRRSSRPSLASASFGYTIYDVPTTVDTYREESKLSDVVRVRESYAQTIMDTQLGYLIKDAV